jgi:hypothetical protein
MSSLRASIGTLLVGLVLTGCGAGPSTPVAVGKVPEPQAPAPPAARPAAPAPPKPQELAGQPLPPIGYEAKGRRDPFAPIQLAKEKVFGLDVTTVRLVGVIAGDQLMALVEAPDGLGYIVKRGDVLGNGRVAEVAPTAITFALGGAGEKTSASAADKKETSVTLRLVKE